MEITFNNCDELINFMVHNYQSEYPYCGNIIFQDSICKVDGMIPSHSTNKMIFPHKSEEYKFLIEDYFDEELNIFIYKIDDNRYDQTVCISLSKYMKDKILDSIINTIQVK